MADKKIDPKYREITISVMICPECDTSMEKVTDRDAATIMTWRCPKCFHCH